MATGFFKRVVGLLQPRRTTTMALQTTAWQYSEHSEGLLRAGRVFCLRIRGTALGFVMREPTMGASPAAQYTLDVRDDRLGGQPLSISRTSCLLQVRGKLFQACPEGVRFTNNAC
jgi:hypothetical protein